MPTRSLCFFLVLLLVISDRAEGWRRRRRRRCPVTNCGVGHWSSWSGCNLGCGSAGTQWRTRSVVSGPSCGGSCPYPLLQYQACNRWCYNGGTPHGGGCSCKGGFTGKCCQGVNGGWSNWNSWSACNQSCGTGEQERNRTCTHPIPINGGKPCEEPSRQSQICNTHVCPVNGGWSSWGNWTSCSKSCGSGSQQRSRSCTNPTPSFGGKSCQGESEERYICNTQPCPARCSSLKAPQFGFVYPHFCSSNPISGTVCNLGCKHGFKRIGGVNEIRCGKDGKWNKNGSSVMKCLDVTPPVFLSCPSDIPVSPSKATTANWKIPVAQDNSNEDPEVTLSLQITPPYTFTKDTVIVYTAKDARGNARNCSFKLLLEDNESPVVTYCPPDQTLTVPTRKSIITWSNPQFRDNSNGPLKVKCSHQSGTAFYWGTWKVQCTAHDSNPNNDPALCQFVVTLKPKECPDLPPPKNGAKACDDWNFGRMCSPLCNDQWDFSQRLPFALWICGGTGKWFPPGRWPDCSRVYRPNQVRMAIDLHYYKGDCTTLQAQRQTKHNFIQMIKGSPLWQSCQDPELGNRCTTDNTKVTCARVPAVNGRKKRSSVNGRTQRPRLILQTTINFDMVVHIDDNIGVNDTNENKIKAGLVGVNIAKKIGSEIRKAVGEGSLSFKVNGNVLLPDKKSLNISEPERTCATGQAYREGFCVSCTPGTYLNKTLGTCEDCPVGSYQEEESQEACVPCPPRTSTEQSRTDDLSGCLAVCKAGSYSPTGLEPCFPCEKGFYQEMEGQRLCLNCSVDTTTAEEGSTSSKQCGAPCPPGWFSPNGLVPCSLCDRRSFQPQSEGRTCVPCPGTTVTTQFGSKRRQDCQEIDNCGSSPCKGNLTCTDLIDDFLCTCQPGYTGKHCETNIDDCSDLPCFNGGTCHDMVNNYSCSCAQGYQGKNCEENIDDCASDPCQNEGTCVDSTGTYDCLCPSGFYGNNCEEEADECTKLGCKNNATCIVKDNWFDCICQKGFVGKKCEFNVEECDSNPCLNGARCIDGINAFQCECKDGFDGLYCENKIDE